MIKKRNIILVNTIFGALISLVNLSCPFILSYLVNNISLEYSDNKLLMSIFVVASIYVISYLIHFISVIVTNKFSVAFKTHESRRMYDALMNKSYSSIIEKQPTYLADRIFNSIETIYTYYATVAKSYILGVCIIVACVAILYFFSVVLGIIFTIVIPVYIIVYWILEHRLQQKCVFLQKNNSKCFADIISVINNVDYYKQLPKRDGILAILNKNLESINRENAKVTVYGTQLENAITTLLNVTNAVTYIIVSVLFVLGNISLSEYVLIAMITAMIFPAVKDIVTANISVRDLKAAISFINEELTSNAERSGDKILDNVKNISFNIPILGYGENVLLRDTYLEISAGDKVFISGPSGCGKTTLIKALLKFIKVKSISVNGIDVNDYDNSSYRSRFAFISQNIPIIHGTIEENILLGENYNLEVLEEKHFMRKFYEMPNGLQTEIFDNGANLSGGDKQKIALARLYIREAQVIILDESLNAIDMLSKNEIISTIFEDFSDATIIMISHEQELSKYFNEHYIIVNKTVTKCEV